MDTFLISKEIFTTLYQLLFILLAFCVMLFSLGIDTKKKNNKGLVNNLTCFFIILYIILVGFRAYNVGTDTGNYYQFSWLMDFPPESTTEILFYWLIKGIKSIEGTTFSFFLLIVSVLFFYFIYKGYILLSKYYNTSILFIVFSFMALFFASSLSINVIRQGLSLAILIYTYGLWLTNKQIKQIIPFVILSVLIHTTSIIPISFFVMINYGLKKQSLNYFYILYFLGIILSAANVGVLNIAPFLNDILQGSRRATYLTDENEQYITGFKTQFVAFNTVFLVIFTYINEILKRRKFNFDYEILLKYYIATSFLFFMAFQIPYSDRWGLFSWIVIPLLTAPIFSIYNKPRFKTPIVLFFILIFIFFQFYG